MKKYILLVITLIINQQIYSQTLNNGGFESTSATNGIDNTIDYNSLNNLINWNASHGVPHFWNNSPSSCNVKLGVNSLLLGLCVNPSFTEYQKSNGVFASYNFVQGSQYEVKYWINTEVVGCGIVQDGGKVNFYAANGLSKYTTPGWFQTPMKQHIESVSTFTNRQLIDNSVTTTPSGWILKTITFTANANYSQFWIFPESTGNPTLSNANYYEPKIDGITITNLTPGNGGTDPSNCPNQCYWRLLGNTSIIEPAITSKNTPISGNFLGTTTNQDVVFAVNNLERMRLTKTGRIDLNNTSGSAALPNTFLEGGNETTSGLANVAMGSTSLNALTSGNYNVAIGRGTLASNTYASNNTGIGDAVLNATTTGSLNTGIGSYALVSNTSGQGNVALGIQSLSNCTVGSNNLGMGRLSLPSLTTGSNNLGIGINSGNGLNTGSNNTFIGSNIQITASALSNHVIIGDGNGAMRFVSFNDGNVFLGAGNALPTNNSERLEVSGTTRVTNLPAKAADDAIVFASSQVGNPAVNVGQLRRLPIIANNTTSFLRADGTWALVPSSASITNICTTIGNIPRQTSTGGNLGCSQIFDNGTTSVGIGTSTGFAYSSLAGATLGSTIPSSSGNVRLDVNGVLRSTASIVTSDGTLKTNIKNLEKALSIVQELNGKTYTWTEEAQKEKGIDNGTHIGFIAQEIQKVLPELVIEDENKELGVNYLEVIPVLVEAIKELNAKVEKQNNAVIENETLKSELASVKEKLANYDEKFALLEKTIAMLCENGCEGLKKADAGAESKDVLYQSIPNPTDKEALINYYLTREYSNAFITLSTTDGKQMMSIKLDAKKGVGSIKVQLGELANGTYLYTLVAGEQVIDTKRLQIIK